MVVLVLLGSNPGWFKSGHKKFGGRKKGSGNRPKRVVPVLKQVRQSAWAEPENVERALQHIRDHTHDLDPIVGLEVALQMAYDAGDAKLIMAAAGMLAPYKYARLQMTALTAVNGNNSDLATQSEEALLEEVTTLRARIDASYARLPGRNLPQVGPKPEIIGTASEPEPSLECEGSDTSPAVKSPSPSENLQTVQSESLESPEMALSHAVPYRS
jgi:hypothetical protein